MIFLFLVMKYQDKRSRETHEHNQNTDISKAINQAVLENACLFVMVSTRRGWQSQTTPLQPEAHHQSIPGQTPESP